MKPVDQEAEQDAWAGRKKVIDVGGLDLAYVEIASAEPPLVLVHGFTDTSRSFSLLAPYLSGRRLIIPDLRGHGASKVGGGCGVADFAGDIAGLIRTLGLHQPVVVGHSLGAMVSIALASRQPELVGGLVVMAGTLKTGFAPDHPLVTGVEALRDPILPADPFFEWWHQCGPEVPRAFLAGMAKDASAMPVARWRAILEEIHSADLTAAAQAVRARTLIIAGGRDPLFDGNHQQRLLKEIPAPFFMAMAHCGHNPHWEDPALVAAAISEFAGPADSFGGASKPSTS
ncbi:Pimeloyl-ACP methyl ester carboxylesterase [Mesorhizobium sp. NFR06]|nr:Pimeloyl-ACP methyl ester carboxylesterase [Mesorhizobium sp. NFR06]